MAVNKENLILPAPFKWEHCEQRESHSYSGGNSLFALVRFQDHYINLYRALTPYH